MNIEKYIKDSIEIKNIILGNDDILEVVKRVINKINECYRIGNKLLIAGNGGSAADSQHFAAEIMCRFKKERKGYPAIALTTDSSILTAWSNDYSFASLFSRQVEALGKENDIFIGLSTSGNSENIIEAVESAKKSGLSTICFLGCEGGKLKDIADFSVIVPSYDTARIQELHVMFMHIICEEIEKNFV